MNLPRAALVRQGGKPRAVSCTVRHAATSRQLGTLVHPGLNYSRPFPHTGPQSGSRNKPLERKLSNDDDDDAVGAFYSNDRVRSPPLFIARDCTRIFTRRGCSIHVDESICIHVARHRREHARHRQTP